jgi:hypothetical protein
VAARANFIAVRASSAQPWGEVLGHPDGVEPEVLDPAQLLGPGLAVTGEARHRRDDVERPAGHAANCRKTN